MTEPQPPTPTTPWWRRHTLRPARWTVLAILAGLGVYLLFVHPELLQCSQQLGDDNRVHQVCEPLPTTSLRVVAFGLVVLVLAAPDFAELEVFGIRLKQLARVEGKVDQLATQVSTTLTAALHSSSLAAGGSAVANPVVHLHVAGASVQSEQPADAVAPGAETVVSLFGAALTGWLAGLGAPWDRGALAGLALDADRQLALVGWAGDSQVVGSVQRALADRARFLIEAIAGAEVTVDPDDGTPMMAAPALLGDRVAGILVAVAPAGTAPEVTAELAAELVGSADAFAALLWLAQVPAGGHRNAWEGQ